MSEFTGAMRMLSARLTTCVQRVNYPIHQGKPNPKHGKFFFVGSIPAACFDADHDNGPFSPRGRSKFYDTEKEALEAADAAGAQRIQRTDCTFYKGK